MWDASEDQGLAIGFNKGEIIDFLDEATDCENHDFRESRDHERCELRNSKYRFVFSGSFCYKWEQRSGA